MIRAVFSKQAQRFTPLMARYPMRSSWRAFRPEASAEPRLAPVTTVARMSPGGSGTHPGPRPRQSAHRLRHHRLRARHAAHRRAGLHRHLRRATGRSAAHHPRACRRADRAASRPQEIAVERVFLSKNADSALKLGQARGAALAAVPATLGVHEYAPRAIKLAVVGVGGAEKTQVAHMVKQLLRIELRARGRRGRRAGGRHLPRAYHRIERLVK